MIQRPKNPLHENHLLLLEKAIPSIKNLANLTHIRQPRVDVSVLPVRTKYLDAFPVRVIAVTK